MGRKSIYNISGIYFIKNNQNGKIYVGSATNIRKRWKSHRNRLRRNTHDNYHLQNVYNKYGMEIFDWGLLEKVENKELLFSREQFYIDDLKSYDRTVGYNINRYATSPYKRIVKDSTRKKQSQIKKGVKRDEDTKNKILKTLYKKVYQLDTETLDVINEYSSVKEAGVRTGISKELISQCARGVSKTAKGYYWTYDVENFTRPVKYNAYPANKKRRFVRSDDLDMEWKSIKKAGDFLGLTKNQIYTRIEREELKFIYKDV